MRADTWRMDAASGYRDSLQARGQSLGVVGGRLRIPTGHTEAELELVRLFKHELLTILQQDAQDLVEERAAILEFQAGFSREDAERMTGLHTLGDAS